MISFRYHLVSVIAVFLALALGIIVGTTALNGPITTDLRKQVNSLKSDRTDLANQVKDLQTQVGDASDFAAAYGPSVVASTLDKQDVLVVAMPGASSTTRDAVESELNQAGAKITGRLSLTTSYVDQARSSQIVQVATSTHPTCVSLPEVSDPGQLGGALLAAVLLGLNCHQSDLDQVVTAFSSLHMLSVEDNNITATSTVVVIGTGALAEGDWGAGMELAFVTALQQAGGHVVVAGNTASASESGLVASVRADDLDKQKVSTIDNADTAIGQVSTVLAVVNSLNSEVGHYGTAKTAKSLFPNPAK